MGREEIEVAVVNLRVAHRMFDGSIEGAGRILRAREGLQNALDAARRDEASAFTLWCSALSEYGENLIAAGNGDGVILSGVQQSEGSSKFLAREAAATSDGRTRPEQGKRAGWAAGGHEGANGTQTTPHVSPREAGASD